MLNQFLTQLFEHGRVTVGGLEDRVPVDEAVRAQLSETDRVRRMNLPEGLPSLDLEAAVWGAERLYQAAVLLVHREATSEQAAELLRPWSAGPPAAIGADAVAHHFSVDLCLQSLRDVIRMSELAAVDDPVNDQLRKLLQEWPLSAVGSGMCQITADSPVWEHPSLRLMFVDRALREGDSSAVEPEFVKEELRQLAGGFPELFPEVLD